MNVLCVKIYAWKKKQYEEVYAQLLVHRFFLPPLFLVDQRTKVGTETYFE
jgi:hypothetical protein